MKANDFDLIVIGAGPAGSCAASTAAKHGVSVLLLEEHPQIGVPLACAEGLSRSSITGYLEINSEWISQELSGSIIRGPEGEEFRVEYPNVGWILNRKIFDPALTKIAEANGVVVKTSAQAIGVEDDEVIVNEIDGQRRYSFKFLIGADGVVSRVGKWLGIDTRLNLNEIVVCAQYLIDGINVEPQYAGLIFGKDYAPGSYAWIFPKSGNSANVGLGISPLCTKQSARYFLDQWVEKEFSHGKIKEMAFSGVPAKMLEQFSGKNFFLIGDAARLTDPLSGAGIANAVKSGIIAGRNVVLRLKEKKDYFEAEIKKEIISEIEFHNRVRNVYLKLTDKEYKEIFKIGRKIFDGKRTADVDMHQLVKSIVLSSPRLLRLGFNILF